jgi:NodT family efflux transporter outer membrane factor (OMF) lipoprotein
MILRRISIFNIILLLAHGCATVPQHDLAEKMTTTQCNTVALNAIESGLFEEGNWPKATWWNDFEDPTLNDLIEQSLKLSPTLQKAESRLKAAAQVALQKKARLFPEIDGDFIDNWQHLSKHGLYRQFAPVFPAIINQIDLDLNFTYEFDFWGKNRDIFHAYLGRAAAQAAEKKQAELILTTSVAYVYFQVQFSLKKLEILEKIERNKREIYTLTIKRERDALSNSLDGLTSSSMALDVEAEVLATEQDLRTELHKLKALTALGQDTDLEIKWTPLKETNAVIPANLAIDLLSRRPDLTAQLLRLEAAAKEIDAAKTDFYPNVNLAAFIGFETVKKASLLNPASYAAALAPAVHLPIFTAGRLKAQLFEKVALFNEAVYAYNELILQAAQEVADGLTNLTLLRKQVDVRKVTVDNAERKTDLAESRFKNAIDDKISLLDTRNTLLERELELTTLYYARQTAQVQLIRALGGGYHHE